MSPICVCTYIYAQYKHTHICRSTLYIYTLCNCFCPLEVFVILNLVNTLHYSAKVRVLCMFKALEKNGNNFISLKEFYNFYHVLNLTWGRVSVCVCVCVCTVSTLWYVCTYMHARHKDVHREQQLKVYLHTYIRMYVFTVYF